MFTIYPNPATDIITISFGNADPKNIEVYNTNGQLLHTFHNVSVDNYTLEVTNLANGTYIINIAGDVPNCKKFIKQ